MPNNRDEIKRENKPTPKGNIATQLKIPHYEYHSKNRCDAKSKIQHVLLINLARDTWYCLYHLWIRLLRIFHLQI